ncbi:early nodulin-like protein 1 [Phalaenopsis equestris]|uniref:early nodulin-like protein 1 n=1 Tax=Phalaenopsis equestris TaxID=78828 RepID=UPI0009E29BE5|nr:early nodulin-like protein 1 [Phalaenopsis equestris]
MEATFPIFLNLLLILSLLSLSSVSSLSVLPTTDFAIGGDGEWAIPSSKNPDFYNKWASNNRFKVNDTIHFKYDKDSVMVVTESEYSKCRSMHPIFFSNNGRTKFKFDRVGLFYFISGVSGHCERGERMIVKVIAAPVATPPEGIDDDNSPNSTAGALSSSLLHVFLLTVGSLVLMF